VNLNKLRITPFNVSIKKCFFSSVPIIIMLAVLLLCFTACSTGKAGNMVFKEEQNGESVNLKPGDSLKIKLESNQTTGYSWQLSDKTDDKIISLVSSIYETSSEDKNIVGAGGYETFILKAVSSGQTDLIFNYERPWEEDVEPADTYILKIVVK